MTFFLGWLLGSITFVAGWALRATVERRKPIDEFSEVQNIAAHLKPENPDGTVVEHTPSDHSE